MKAAPEIIWAVVIFAGLILSAGAALAVKKKMRDSNRSKRLDITDYLINRFEDEYSGEKIRFMERSFGLFLELFVHLRQSALLSDSFKEKFIAYCAVRRTEEDFSRKLDSFSAYTRCRCAVYLGYIAKDTGRAALEKRLIREKHWWVKIYIVHALCELKNPVSILFILDTLPGSPVWYRRKVFGLTAGYGIHILNVVLPLRRSPVKEDVLFAVQYADLNPSDEFFPFLKEKTGDPDSEISSEALRVLLRTYLHKIDVWDYLSSEKTDVARTAVAALENSPTEENVNALIWFLRDHRLGIRAVDSLTKIAFASPRFYQYLFTRFSAEANAIVRSGIAASLSCRTEYLLVRFSHDFTVELRDLLLTILSLGKTSDIIAFLKKNRSESLEERLVKLVREALPHSGRLAVECVRSLDERLLSRIGIEKPGKPPAPAKREEKVKVILLAFFLMLAVTIIPALFAFRLYPFEALTLKGTLFGFISFFNYAFAWYAMALNGSYIVLLILSWLGARTQQRFWDLKQFRFLFCRKILPSVSLIAPAYREEASIVESVSSLLNLQYPEYEVVVVNDGSTDATLGRLISAFSLERADVTYRIRIPTMTIRGIYMNPSIPRLIVVDKENGGKADSLNAGINISTKEYFCGIDADSILEKDALLKIVSPLLDTDLEVVASGGNIFPVNGCEVDRGSLNTIHIPKNHLARLQMLEYIRSFMGGRIGWAYTGCLLIISGAFGVFSKQRVIEAGGYLTSKGGFKKDTVGEDMELVVRLSRHMREKKLPHLVQYCFNANCWTEVPESLQILKRQRERWIRGLLDIMTYHIRMLFNPRYGRVGLVAFPYFLLFEVLGPWIELQGLVIFISSIFLGLLDPNILLLLLLAGILMGIFVSMQALLIVEKDISQFRLREIFILIGYALAENFGPHHVLNLFRITGYKSALAQTRGWGEMKRKGFIAKS
jgi:cellulose synthase/poly-beta-1,6-N-acetylglucosamine synthase-like glycosyltransferase